MSATSRVVRMDETPEEKLRIRIHVHLNQDGGNPSQLLEMLHIMVEDEIWKCYGMTFCQFVETSYNDGGLGWSTENLMTVLELRHRDEFEGSNKKTIIQDLAAMRKFIRGQLQADIREPGRPQPQFDNGNNSTYDRVNDDYYHHLHGTELLRNQLGSTGKNYILARLKRDHPATFESYLNGEFPSARQAGIAAGFVKDVKRIQVSPDPKKIAAKVKEILTTAQIQELIELLKD